MGGGVSFENAVIDKKFNNLIVLKESSSSITLSFDAIEKKCFSGYFKDVDKFKDYVKAFEHACKLNSLDIIEVLLKAGDIRSINPFHIASTNGNLEVVEILYSAGLYLFNQDHNGCSPLHLCVMKPFIESSLCATFLCIVGGSKLLKLQDKNGNTALHYCIIYNNIPAYKILISYSNKDINSMRNKNGKTVEDLAIESGQVQFYGKKKKKDIPMDQIIKVWERFFENAMNITNGNSHDMINYKNTATKNDIKSNKIIPMKNDLIDWLKCILCKTDDDEYYIVNTVDGYSIWLSDFLEEKNLSYLYHVTNDVDICDVISINDIISHGWIQYFDVNSNYVYWMNISSGYLSKTIKILPLNTDIYPLKSLILKDNGKNITIGCDSSISSDWVCVINDTIDDLDSHYYSYYWNTRTNQTIENCPVNYEHSIKDGYYLCYSINYSSYYWYDSKTNESVWV
jgi:hypothetical protein